MNRYFSNIALDAPHYVVPVVSLNQAYDIKAFCRKHNITSGVYGFEMHGINQKPRKPQLFNRVVPDSDIVNIGMSLDVGERLYRKAAYLPEWPTLPLSFSGKDMKEKVLPLTESFYDLFPGNVHKDDFDILIWDIGNMKTTSFVCPSTEAEKELFNQYAMENGRIPAGNMQDPRKRNSKNRQSANYTYNNLFTAV